MLFFWTFYNSKNPERKIQYCLIRTVIDNWATNQHIRRIFEVKVTWHVAKYGYPYSEFVLCFLTHPKCTHTVNTHPAEQWAAIYSAAPGEQLGVRCLAQGHLSRGIEGGRDWIFTPPTYNSCRTWDSNSQPLGYESDSLTIRPRLPRKGVRMLKIKLCITGINYILIK